MAIVRSKSWVFGLDVLADDGESPFLKFCGHGRDTTKGKLLRPHPTTLHPMLLTPRYDEPFFLQLDLPLGDPALLLVRQRRRLAALLGELDDEQWAAPSRCAEWSVQDVVAHLVSVNQFWAFSIGAALGGEPKSLPRHV